MKPELNEALLDEVICRAIGTNVACFDEDRWKSKYREELMTLESRTADAAGHHGRRRSWRSTKLNQLSIAASTVLIVGVGAYMLLLHPASAAEMLHRTAMSSSGYDGWVHIRGQFERTDASGSSHTASIEGYLNPVDGTEVNIRQLDGRQVITMYRPSRQEVFDYDSGSKEVWIRSIGAGDASFTADREPVFSWLLAALRRSNKSDGITTSRTREGSLDRYDILYPSEVLQNQERPVHAAIQCVWVDPATQLIRKIWCQGNRETLSLDWSYEGHSIRDIYDVGVPRETKVVDARSEEHEARIAAQFDIDALRRELKRRVETGFGDHTAMVMQSHLRPDGSLEPWCVHIMRKRGQYERSDDLYVGENKSISDLRQYVAQDWPNLTFSQVFEAEARGPVDARVISDPTQVILSNQFLGGGIRKFPAGCDTAGAWSMAWLTWRYHEVFEPDPMRGEKIDLTLLPLGTRLEPWIGLQAIVTGKTPNGEPKQRTDTYWYNPGQSYVLMESSKTYWDPDSVILSSERVTLDIAQTASGESYPSHVRETLKLKRVRSGVAEVVDSMRDERIVLDTGLIPDEGLFAAECASVKR